MKSYSRTSKWGRGRDDSEFVFAIAIFEVLREALRTTIRRCRMVGFVWKFTDLGRARGGAGIRPPSNLSATATDADRGHRDLRPRMHRHRDIRRHHHGRVESYGRTEIVLRPLEAPTPRQLREGRHRVFDLAATRFPRVILCGGLVLNSPRKVQAVPESRQVYSIATSSGNRKVVAPSAN